MTSKADDVILAARAKYESLPPDRQTKFMELCEKQLPSVAAIIVFPEELFSEPVRERLNEMRRRRAAKAAR